MVICSADAFSPVRRDDNMMNHILMSLEDHKTFSTLKVPNTKGTVIGSCDETTTVRGDGKASNISIMRIFLL
jgi:hypothetical protein